MRIGIDAHALASRSSGNETYFEQLIQHVAKAATNGIRHVVYYTHPDGGKRVSRFSEVVRDFLMGVVGILAFLWVLFRFFSFFHEEISRTTDMREAEES